MTTRASTHQYRRAACRSRDARPARVQRQVPDRDGRGGGLTGLRELAPPQGPVAGRGADRLRWATSRPRATDAFPGLARRHHVRRLRSRRGRRPSLRQLGRSDSDPALQRSSALEIVRPKGQIQVPEWVRGDPRIGCDVPSRIANSVAVPRARRWSHIGARPASPGRRCWLVLVHILALEAGSEPPVNAMPPRAWARCQLRYVVGIDR